MLPFPLHVSQVTMWNFENGNVDYYQQILKYQEYAKIMAAACAVHANVMMGRHPMAAVPPHAHTQPHAHQGAAPKPHNVMLQQPRASGYRTQLISPQSNAPNGHSQGISTGNYTVWKKKQKTKSRQNPCAPGPHLDTPSCWQRARLPIPP